LRLRSGADALAGICTNPFTKDVAALRGALPKKYKNITFDQKCATEKIRGLV